MKVLILGNKITNKYDSLIQSLSKKDGVEVGICSYKNLAFYIDDENSSIRCFPTNEDVRDYDKIIILADSPRHLQNYIFSALSCYCRKYNIEMLDDVFSNTDGKLYSLWRFWEKGVPVAKTAFGPVDFLCQKFHQLGGSCILKSVQGTKGKDCFLIRSEEELRKVINNNEDAAFILQEFIENDGDWRIVLINYEPKLAIYRSSHGKDHRNNTSVGGDATLVPLEEVEPKILNLAINSTRALEIKIAGADILPGKNGSYTVLEVNNTPQLVTGAFTDAKIKVLTDFIVA